jgi:hypothetical protein
MAGSGGMQVQGLYAEITANAKQYFATMGKVNQTGQKTTQQQTTDQKKVQKETKQTTMGFTGMMAAFLALSYVLAKNSGYIGAALDFGEGMVGIFADTGVEGTVQVFTDLTEAVKGVTAAMTAYAEGDYGKAVEESADAARDFDDALQWPMHTIINLGQNFGILNSEQADSARNWVDMYNPISYVTTGLQNMDKALSKNLIALNGTDLAMHQLAAFDAFKTKLDETNISMGEYETHLRGMGTPSAQGELLVIQSLDTVDKKITEVKNNAILMHQHIAGTSMTYGTLVTFLDKVMAAINTSG